MYRKYLMVLLFCIFLVACSATRNKTQNDSIEQAILTLNEEYYYTYLDPIYDFTVSFPEKYSFFIHGNERFLDTDYDSPDRSVYIYLDTEHICDSGNYIRVTGQLGRAHHVIESGEKRIEFINDAGQEATMHYKTNDNEFNFTWSIKNANQIVRGYFELDFYEKNKDTIIDICKSVHHSP